MKKALITGITGQDGSYLAELLLEKGYEVYGLVRRTSTNPFGNIKHLVKDNKVKIIYGNMTDLDAVRRAVKESDPDEIYNLAAQSDVGISFKCPVETMETNYYSFLRLVEEAIDNNPFVKIYQASTSEMFGSTPPPQNEETYFNPVSPYGIAKLKAHKNVVKKFREINGAFICSGILFNHESPRRGEHFVTRKIVQSMCKFKLGLQGAFQLGNLDAKRDWGYSKDYVKAMWLMLQQEVADDYVIATGDSHTVREFIIATANALDMDVHFEGEGMKEKCIVYDGKEEKIMMTISPEYYRPNEVNYLLGDASKAKEKLGWEPKTNFEELVYIMVEAEMQNLKHE